MNKIVYFTFALVFFSQLYAGEDSSSERRFARWSECYKGVSYDSENSSNKSKFYLLIEGTDNLPFIYENSKGQFTTSGYAFYLRVEHAQESADSTPKRETLLSVAHTEDVLTQTKKTKSYSFLHAGEKVEITLSPNGNKLVANNLIVDANDENSEKPTQFYYDLDLKLEKLDSIEECLK